MKLTIYSPDQQAVGEFDGGKITELKPIGFPGEGSVVRGIGPLFYWSWFKADKEGAIPMHPHQAFEIVTYMVDGQAEHADTLGTQSRVSSGGAQVMQTGSGVSHSERFIGPKAEGFQIWFEPYIREALNRIPTYTQYEHDIFPRSAKEGLIVKTVIGEGSPIELVSDVRMLDVELEADSEYSITIDAGRTLAALLIRGKGVWIDNQYGKQQDIHSEHQDFIVLEADTGESADATLRAEERLRVILIDIPTEVNYPLYKNK
jgi:redox-sensitive bicupin YhaK (pirin superfamily)